MRKHYESIEQQTQNRFLNMYHINALDSEGKHFDYYFASRNDASHIKHATHSRRPEGMAVYAVTEDGEYIVLERQYRYPINDYVYELPAGLIETGEGAAEAAVREMLEETGLAMTVYEGGEAACRNPFFLAQGFADESGSMIYGTVENAASARASGESAERVAAPEASEDITVILADRGEALRILKEERLSMRCGMMLMHFVKSNAAEPFAFLEL